jgi:predicted transcriptional regulator
VLSSVKPPPSSNERQEGATSIAPPRRQQLSVKISDEACERFRRLARAHGLTLGELFEQALEAWETHRPVTGTAARAALAGDGNHAGDRSWPNGSAATDHRDV